MKHNNKQIYQILVGTFYLMMGRAVVAFASTVSTSVDTTNRPWEAGLSNLMTSLKGPIAATVAVAAFALCTWQIIRGAELSSWVAPMIVAALAVATLVNSEKLLTMLADGTDVNSFETVSIISGALPESNFGEVPKSMPLR